MLNKSLEIFSKTAMENIEDSARALEVRIIASANSLAVSSDIRMKFPSTRPSSNAISQSSMYSFIFRRVGRDTSQRQEGSGLQWYCKSCLSNQMICPRYLYFPVFMRFISNTLYLCILSPYFCLGRNANACRGHRICPSNHRMMCRSCSE